MTARVAVLFRDLGHYHDARLRGAVTEGGLEVTAIASSAATAFPEFAPPSAARPYAVRALYSDLDTYRAAVAGGGVGRQVGAALDATDADAVAVAGWSEPESVAAIRWARRKRRGIVLMSESRRDDAPRSRLREWVKSVVVRRCHAALVGGRAHRDYVVGLGMPPASVSLGYDAVDNHHFDEGSRRARADGNGSREKHGLPERYILACARLVPKKNISGLLRAYAGYVGRTADPHHLVVVGDGPERESLLREIGRLGVADLVRLPGFVGYDLLPVHYGFATLFVHASLVEQWGLVVNEAMAAGLPVVVSDRCGCADELVRDGVNGRLFDPADPKSLTNILCDLLGGSADLPAMGEASRSLVAPWGADRFGRGLRDAVACARRQAATQGGWELALPAGVLLRLLGRMRFERVT